MLEYTWVRLKQQFKRVKLQITSKEIVISPIEPTTNHGC